VLFFTKYEQFAKDVQLLLLGFGITCRRVRAEKKAGDGHVYTGNELQLRANEACRFNEEIGFIGSRKAGRYLEWKNSGKGAPRIPLRLMDTVKAIERCGEEEVFDITTESGTFSGNGILVHNCWTEAFLSSGDHAIPAETRKQHRKTVQAPKYARLEWCDKAKTLTRLVPCDYDANGCWRIWEEPKPAHDYAAGGDVSEGLPIDPSDIHGKRDRSAMVVLNRRYLRTAAMWVGTMDPDLFGEEMVKAGRYWNNAWIAPEVNNAGQSTLDRIRQMGYPKLYQRQRGADEINLTPRSLLGWRTTATTRDYLIDRYLEACRENPDREIGWLMSFVNLSSELADEEDTFIRKEKKREHRDGARDDILFAAMIAVEVHRTCPRECVYPQYAETMEEVRLGSEFINGYANGTFHHGGMTVVSYKSS